MHKLVLSTNRIGKLLHGKKIIQQEDLDFSGRVQSAISTSQPRVMAQVSRGQTMDRTTLCSLPRTATRNDYCRCRMRNWGLHTIPSTTEPWKRPNNRGGCSGCFNKSGRS